MIYNEVGQNLLQITLDDERWYRIVDELSGAEEFHPSATWILKHYPKGEFFKKYLMSLSGPDEEQAILSKASKRGSRVHWALEELLKGRSVSIHDAHPELGHMDAKEWQMVQSGLAWIQRYSPEVEAIETTVIGDGYAGTVDLLCTINGKRYVIDWKTSGGIYDTMKFQVAAYFHALGGDIHGIGIVRVKVPNARTRIPFQFWETTNLDEIRTLYKQFLCAKTIWAYQNPNPNPEKIMVPETVSVENIEVGEVYK